MRSYCILLMVHFACHWSGFSNKKKFPISVWQMACHLSTIQINAVLLIWQKAQHLPAFGDPYNFKCSSIFNINEGLPNSTSIVRLHNSNVAAIHIVKYVSVISLAILKKASSNSDTRKV